jgi:CheY-like chemotaxis protein
MRRPVLLVTNNLLTREALVEPLEDWGHDVLVADDAREAVGLCRGRAVQAVLVDLDSPPDSAWEGWEVIRGTLRAKPWLPIVIITGRLDLGAAARAAGARGLAGKPLDVEALVQLVEDLVAERADPRATLASPRVRDFRHVPANEDAFRAAIMERMRRPFLTAEHNRHWGLNE